MLANPQKLILVLQVLIQTLNLKKKKLNYFITLCAKWIAKRLLSSLADMKETLAGSSFL